MAKRRELIAKPKDGTEFPVELGLAEITTVWDEKFFCGFLRDIRRQKYDQDELTEKERLTFGLLEVSCDSLFAIDGSQRIFLANSATSKHLGWSKDEIFGMNLFGIMPKEENVRVRQMKAIEKHM